MKIVVKIEKHWTTSSSRTNDVFLIDEIIKYKFSPQQLKTINSCRLYLKVLLLSDITTANGRHILSTVHKGLRPKDRDSKLQWPRQEKPLVGAQALRDTALDHTSTNHKLHKPLGPWLRVPHQKWIWFKNETTNVSYWIKLDTLNWI